MPIVHDFPVLDSPAKCAALWPKYPENVVGLWATGMPRQNVDVLWRLRQELLTLNVPVVFFFNESALTMLNKVMSEDSFSHSDQHIYQLDDAKLFRLLNFVEVLVTNDYQVYYQQSRYIQAKLFGLSHHANLEIPYVWNYFYDYFVSVKDTVKEHSITNNYIDNTNVDGCRIDFKFYPDICKIHHNSSFTELVAGHPKIDLILEERQKKASSSSTYVLLLYPTYIDFCMTLQKIGPALYEEIWCEVISSFLARRPDGLVVFRPVARERAHPLVERIKARFADDGRFFVDEDDDNKFWLARANYFVTDYSSAFINFSMTSKKPSIRMVYTQHEITPIRDEWGWTISRPNHLPAIWEEMDGEEQLWTATLHEKQKREMPTLGKNFSLIAGMIQRIFDDNEDPAWPRIDKGHTPCETPGDLLKLVAKCTKKSGYELLSLTIWMKDVLNATANQHTPQIWLSFLRRATLPYLDRDSPADIAYHLNQALTNTLDKLPIVQTVGLLRHCIGKDSVLAATALLLTVMSNRVPGLHKKRTLFLLLMEWEKYNRTVLTQAKELAERMPQHFSQPVLDKLTRLLPLAMKVPLSLRRFAARIVSMKKPLAKKYWRAHRTLT